jgi:hypothetical protein
MLLHESAPIKKKPLPSMNVKNRHKEAEITTPDLAKLRPGMFWDTDITKIDWLRQQRAVIERVTQRGNDQEIAEIKRFYGDEAFNKTVDSLKRQP